MRKGISLKISVAIGLMGAISIITVLILSLMGYSKINLLKGNVQSMYNSDIKKVELSRKMATDIAVVHADVRGQMLEYNAALDSKIESNLAEVNRSVESYSEITDEEQEKKSLEELTKITEKYKETWNNIKEKISLNEEVDGQAKAELVLNEKMMIDGLKRVVNKNDINAQKKYFSSDIAASKSAKIFTFVSLCGLMNVGLISFFVIYGTKKSMKNMVKLMDIIAKGNLNVEIDTTKNNEFGVMSRSLSKTVDSVSRMISNIVNKTDGIVDESLTLDEIAKEMVVASKGVYGATKIMAEGSTSQAQDLMSIDKQFNEFNDMLNDMIEAVKDISENNKDIHRLTVDGEERMNSLTDSSQKVSSSFDEFIIEFRKFIDLIQKVNDIVSVITELTEQTKLLSLNASIEAARAGEHGKGFVVVAEEVNQLSEESRKSADKITELINTISKVAEEIIGVANGMGQELNMQKENTDNITIAIQNIIKNISKSSSKIEFLNNSAYEIIGEKDKLIDRVINASSIAEEISASAEEITASASQMDLYANKVVNASKNLGKIVNDTVDELNKFDVEKEVQIENEDK